jgi:small subunit ribosomal protein S20
MANIKSQIKRNKQNEVRRERNKAARSELRTRAKSALSAIESGAEDVGALVQAAVKRIDKTAAKGVIHPNQAARRKSRLMRHANAAAAADAAES